MWDPTLGPARTGNRKGVCEGRGRVLALHPLPGHGGERDSQTSSSSSAVMYCGRMILD